MKPTKISNLITYLIGAGVFAFTFCSAFVSRGLALPISPGTLTATLFGIAIALVLLGIPMLSYRSALKDPKKKTIKRVPPLFAFRVVIVAKASAVVANLFLGWHLGLVVLQLTLPVIPLTVFESALSAGASAAMLGAALWLENIYRIPPDIEEPVEGSPA